jgi:hypothetical protein
VDPINGDDAAVGDGADIQAPMLTISATITDIQSSLRPPGPTNRYVIWLFPGGTDVSEDDPILWHPWISLFGYGARTSTVLQNIRYTAAAGEASAVVFSNIELVVPNALLLDVQLGDSVQVQVQSSNISFVFVGTDVPLQDDPTRLNELYLYSSTIVNADIVSGIVRARDGTTLLSNLTLGPGIQPTLEMTGGVVLGNAYFNGEAYVSTTGVQWLANIVATEVTDGTYWTSDASSLPWTRLTAGLPPFFVTPPTVTGTIFIEQTDTPAVAVFPVNSPFQVTFETLILADATTANVTIALPATQFIYAGVPTINQREIIVKKVAGTFAVNVVCQQPASNSIDGRSIYRMIAPLEFAGFVGSNDFSAWHVVRQGTGGGTSHG